MTEKTIARPACLALAALLLLSGASAARAQESGSCEVVQQTGPVSLLILASGRKVHDLAATVRDSKVLVRDAHTVVFRDGRIITSDVAAVSDHINALGWEQRSINIVASAAKPKRRPRRRG